MAGHENADKTDMNVNSLSNIGSYLQSMIGTAISSATGSTSTSGTSSSTSSSIDPSSLTMPQDSSPQLSPFAQILSTLQQLQQSNPTEYQQVTSQIASNLQTAAQTATSDGDTSQATELSQLATDFNNASQNNTLPNIQDLAQALGGAHGHHHHHMSSSGSSSTSDSSTGSSSTSSTSSSGSTSSASGSSTPDAMLTQLISMFMGNNTSATQANSSLDPLSIINNTLTSAGL
jgi:trimeric autotransporter adhesin